MMIKCNKCHNILNDNNIRDGYKCDKCGFAPEKINGFYSWAPEKTDKGFDPDSFSFLFEHEKKHFWFQSRNKLIVSLLKRFAGDFKSLMEIGCGTGVVLTAIADSFPQATLVGTDLFPEALPFVAQRLPDIRIMQMDAEQIPFEDEFDVIIACDVLEHITDDQKTIKNCCKALKPKGIFLITVPQHPFLWSKTDEQAHHVRRYTAQEIHTKITEADFKILFSSSFVTFLLPFMMVSRLLGKINPKQSENEFLLPNWLNILFNKIMGLEYFLLQAGIKWPVGGSRIIVAQKNLS